MEFKEKLMFLICDFFEIKDIYLKCKIKCFRYINIYNLKVNCLSVFLVNKNRKEKCVNILWK